MSRDKMKKPIWCIGKQRCKAFVPGKHEGRCDQAGYLDECRRPGGPERENVSSGEAGRRDLDLEDPT